ncbi:hypothetical protein PFISCL1PPCAC_7876 [Pristionchus fissidentatus]|uniref:Uncharacterized protein n=1 Tax=Pristionchus fissidentatus TaxID=1538716 RepID=A0AAV5VAW3_9BILA|nr:hypothetical protein PFISCL1PPCAC_7876 [Pristionchus fissidentatus]
MDSLRDQFFKSIDNLAEQRTLHSALHFFSSLIHFYTIRNSDFKRPELCSENMSEEEKEIFKYFANEEQLISVLFHTEAVRGVDQFRYLGKSPASFHALYCLMLSGRLSA